MRHALIIAGGSGTRLWPMSRKDEPKQLIAFIAGRSLLQIALERLEGLVPRDRQYICAGEVHRQPIYAALRKLGWDAAQLDRQFLGEPTGRDTLNAVGLGAAVIGQRDPDAVIAVFTADHLIEPVDKFQTIVERGYALAEREAKTLVTFGITPTHAATGYGYLQLGKPIDSSAFVVDEFKEKPDAATAQRYLDAGREKYLWNSGMFVWRAATLMDCIGRYEPENHAGLSRLGQAWDTPECQALLEEVYPKLKKISVDFAVMEPASHDAMVQVAAVPMPLQWLDVGSWPAFAKTLKCDDTGSATAGCRHVAIGSRNVLAASSTGDHLIATIGCEDLIVIHTPDATLVCRSDQAEEIKKIHGLVGERWGEELL